MGSITFGALFGAPKCKQHTQTAHRCGASNTYYKINYSTSIWKAPNDNDSCVCVFFFVFPYVQSSVFYWFVDFPLCRIERAAYRTNYRQRSRLITNLKHNLWQIVDIFSLCCCRPISFLWSPRGISNWFIAFLSLQFAPVMNEMRLLNWCERQLAQHKNWFRNHLIFFLSTSVPIYYYFMRYYSN